MVFDIIVVCLLAVSVGTGVWTIEVHHDYFSDFAVPDLLRGRIDGWLYVLNLCSTAWCAVDIVLRVGWLFDVDASRVMSRQWFILWMGLHAASAVIATMIHVITNYLLRRERAGETKS